mmetsp:Transcript_2385/g.5354  ORF Transcript_2385/g.5354 Transcript_2385/m.5354 type:complete len:207 (-) Transcript_2385:675-1295(-)
MRKKPTAGCLCDQTPQMPQLPCDSACTAWQLLDKLWVAASEARFMPSHEMSDDLDVDFVFKRGGHFAIVAFTAMRRVQEAQRVQRDLEFRAYAHKNRAHRFHGAVPFKLNPQQVIIAFRQLRRAPPRQNVPRVIQRSRALLAQNLDPIVKSDHLVIADFTQKHVLKPGRVVALLATVKVEPQAIQQSLERADVSGIFDAFRFEPAA